MKPNVKKKTRAAKPRETTPAPDSSSKTTAAEERHDRSKEGGSRWTFLTNHSHVLIVLHAEPELVLREVAARVGITERAVQRVVQDLEEEGFIRRERVGRQNRYEVRTDVPLRHPIESHRTIGDLLQLITG
ncbi:helix-turn-helix transcriptional regulator [Rhodopirellula sp. JC639]|uniref:helix-turn-helix transcriptional regulator n=1 Tax=Stieleria mannarensis TaxID=2755585 RepID=UPI0015FF0DAA|nr:helix-turn-helix domain-containing protein [Rhodopirellula sp. JC639]